MHCKDCKHWKRCEGFMYNEKYGDCSHYKFVYEEENPNENDNLVYWDYESYSAGFRTGEDFGCIHFEKKVNE